MKATEPIKIAVMYDCGTDHEGNNRRVSILNDGEEPAISFFVVGKDGATKSRCFLPLTENVKSEILDILLKGVRL